MAQSFDIRFARSGGIAALFDAADNSFGWKGAGRLRIDAQGMSFVLKRGITSVLARRRSQRIPAENIQEVYREGEALRIEFTTGEMPRAVLPFWTRDRDTAARIVQLMPTSRTIEIEDSADEPPERKLARRTPLMLAVAMVVIVASGALFLAYQRPVSSVPPVVATAPASALPRAAGIPATAEAGLAGVESVTASDATTASPIEPEYPAEAAPAAAAATAARVVPLSDRFITPDEARKLAMLAEDPVDWTKPPPPSSGAFVEAAAREDRMARLDLPDAPDVDAFVPMEIPEVSVPVVVVPIKQTTLAYATARDMLYAFEADAAKLTEAYRSERARFGYGTLDSQAFANRLDALEIRWRGVSDRILGDHKYEDPALAAMRGTLLTVVVQQRVFLTGYGAGLRAGDQARVDRAFVELARADEALERARQYLN